MRTTAISAGAFAPGLRTTVGTGFGSDFGLLVYGAGARKKSGGVGCGPGATGPAGGGKGGCGGGGGACATIVQGRESEPSELPTTGVGADDEAVGAELQPVVGDGRGAARLGSAVELTGRVGEADPARSEGEERLTCDRLTGRAARDRDHRVLGMCEP